MQTRRTSRSTSMHLLLKVIAAHRTFPSASLHHVVRCTRQETSERHLSGTTADAAQEVPSTQRWSYGILRHSRGLWCRGCARAPPFLLNPLLLVILGIGKVLEALSKHLQTRARRLLLRHVCLHDGGDFNTRERLHVQIALRIRVV